jgi:hypothetical protein
MNELPIKSKWFIFEKSHIPFTYIVYNKKHDQEVGTLEPIGNKNNWVFTSYGKFIYDEKSLEDIVKAIKYLKGKENA